MIETSALAPQASSSAKRGRGTAEGGGGGGPRSNLRRTSSQAAMGSVEVAAAPSTILRMVPLPRFTEEDVRVLLALAALYAGGCLLGLGLLVTAFRLGLLGGIDILFYRGLVLIALGAAATFAILALGLRRAGFPALGTRDAFAVSVVSLALNLSFLVVVPVTVDRSISIFLLGAMAAHPDAALTPEAASTLFKTVYVDDYRQIDRRLREQAVSGNLEKVGDGYRISPRGRAVVAAAKATAWLFDSHAGLVAPRDHEATVGVR